MSLLWKALAALALLAALFFTAAAARRFQQTLAEKIERTAAIEAAAARPAAAARLAAVLLERRLATVEEKASQAVSAAFRHADAAEALEAYRQARGDQAILAEAEKVLRQAEAPDPAGDVAFLRSIRALREQAAQAPKVTPPLPPLSAFQAQRLLLWAAGCAVAGPLFAFLAGRSSPPAHP